ncbi:BrnA antitoxin family protein [Jannaschia sp. LMIT008]|uniref:BrnA antitoxin family protein n=1 Tax=Jannaschia maritima TaxID=3032585 RepID=UPI0028117E9E|nr:BrnA antitoxin family protein [Jannaschia sp. LMIT008]
MRTTDVKGKKRDHLNDLFRQMSRLEWDLMHDVTVKMRLPREWEEIWETRSPAKTRVTVRLDDDVLKFFRAMGDGYGPRMNAVLRTFMLARLSGMMEGEDLPEAYREKWLGKARP